MPKAGMVIRLRVSPKDCMSVVDAGQMLGLRSDQYSMSALTSLVLSSLLEVQRRSGTIPVRSGFEYSRMMEPFQDRKGALRQKMTAALYQGAASALPVDQVSGQQERNRETVGEATQEELMLEFKELHERWETLTPEEVARYNDLNAVLFS